MDFVRLNPHHTTQATVSYADIFDYPLTPSEVKKWALIGATVKRGVRGIEYKNGFFFLKGRSALVTLRRRRRLEQEEKWAIARRTARWLSIIPTIQLVGVTGGLAMDNAKTEDDIDFFIVVANGAMWITRFLAILLISFLHVRRKPNDKDVKNKICLNMFVTNRGLTVVPHQRDCFVAHEVLQMQPLWEQQGIYRKFLYSNTWTQAYLPNAWRDQLNVKPATVFRTPALVVWFFRIFEFPAKIIQILYMERKKTNEVVTDSVLRFHPKDARIWVRQKLAARLARFNIPLDIVFTAS